MGSAQEKMLENRRGVLCCSGAHMLHTASFRQWLKCLNHTKGLDSVSSAFQGVGFLLSLAPSAHRIYAGSQERRKAECPHVTWCCPKSLEARRPGG